jgi:predicted transcriptional regulator
VTGYRLQSHRVVTSRWDDLTILTVLNAVADPVKLALVRCLLDADGATVLELSERCGASVRTTRRYLDVLTALGIVVKDPGSSDGVTPGRPASRFVLSPSITGAVNVLIGGRT